MVWLVTVITFILLKALPGGPVRAILGTHASDPALVKTLTIQLGLNKPIWYQYWSWLDGFLHGNFGFSYVQNQSVASLLGQWLPRTLLLLGTATLLALVIAVPFGIIQAVRRNRVADYLGTGFSFLFYAMPVYLTGIILINVFVFETHTFPAEGAQGGTWSFFTQFNAMILPVITLTLVTLASFSRYMRSSTLDQLTQDYVRTARAKGAGQPRILYRHILRNALIPIATLVGPAMTTSAAGIGGQPVPSRSDRMPQAASLAPPSGLIMWPLMVSEPSRARSTTRTRRPAPARSIAVAAPAQRAPPPRRRNCPWLEAAVRASAARSRVRVFGVGSREPGATARRSASQAPRCRSGAWWSAVAARRGRLGLPVTARRHGVPAQRPAGGAGAVGAVRRSPVWRTPA